MRCPETTELIYETSGAQDMDFACVETQIGDGSSLDCEILDLDGTKGYYRVVVPC